MINHDDQRRLSAILAADVVGYTRLVEQDSDGTVVAWKAARSDIIDPAISRHSGRIVKHTGDGFLVEFQTVLDAVECAVSMQQELTDSPLDFRMGVNLGDIIDDGEDIHGEGVNIAARIEALAESGSICISGSVFEQVRNRLDHHFVDLGEHQVKHVSAPVHVYQIAAGNAVPEMSKSYKLTLPDKPSIAILPFDNMSGDKDQEYFADGITEDIITNLSRIRWLFVIARNSSFIFKGQTADIRRVSRELGVRYVLEGSVRKSGNHVRITAQLIDAKTSAHLWAERYDRNLTDIFLLQDEITENVAGAIEPAILEAEGIRARSRSGNDISAWDVVMRSVVGMWRMTKEDSDKAISMLELAVEKHPDYGPAHSMLSFSLMFSAQMGWRDLEAVRDTASNLAHRAYDLDDQDAWAHVALGYMNSLARNSDEAILEYSKAIELNPNFAEAYGWRAFAKAHDGQSKEAIEDGEIALRLSPRDPQNVIFVASIALAHFMAGQYDHALKYVDECLRLRTGFLGAHRLRCAAFARSGQIEEAQLVLKKVLELQPGVTASVLRRTLPYSTPENLEKFVGGLVLAGLPD